MAATMCCVDKVSLTFRRFLVKGCRYSTSSHALKVENDVDLYPPVKPKMPEGEWGSMKRRHAWLWIAKKRTISRLNSVQKRIDILTDREMQMWRFKVAENYPRCLSFQQYATKTHLVNGLPMFYDNPNVDIDKIVHRIKPLVIDSISLEQNVLFRDKTLRKRNPWEREKMKAELFLKQLLNAIISSLSGDFPHLIPTQFDEGVRVEAFWDRHGFRRAKVPRYKDVDKKRFEYVDDSRLQSTFSTDFLLRSEDPLPEFLPREDELCVGHVPALEYHPTSYGQVLMRKDKPKVVPGHWSGDPCEFSLLGVNLINDMLSLGDQYGETTLQDLITGTGINSSFVRMVAEAHYQGFNCVEELTYPFTTQTILSDGQRFYFFAYQLNTLELWKEDEANSLRNICWKSGPCTLYESVDDGEVKGFNEDVLRQIVKFLAVRPGRPGVQLHPASLAGKVTRPDSEEYLNEKVEKIVVKKEETYV